MRGISSEDYSKISVKGSGDVSVLQSSIEQVSPKSPCKSSTMINLNFTNGPEKLDSDSDKMTPIREKQSPDKGSVDLEIRAVAEQNRSLFEGSNSEETPPRMKSIENTDILVLKSI